MSPYPKSRRTRPGFWMALSGAFFLAAAAIYLAACAMLPGAGEAQVTAVPSTISGVVTNPQGPVAGAIVQVRGTPNQTTTAKDGAFTLKGHGLGGKTVTTITAWSAGHFVGYVDLDPQKPVWKAGGTGVDIVLKPLYTVDNNKYTWFTFEGVSGSASCGICHREYKEWTADAHSQTAINPRFITMYKGTNAQGKKSQPTKLTSAGKALPPDPSQPYFGPGYQLDFPGRAGNCATCHTPIASSISNTKNCGWSGCHTNATSQNAMALGIMDPGVIPVSLIGVATDGISCDFCHKVGDVNINPKTKLPYPDMPGILSMQLYRPPDGQQLFFGTLVDVNRRVSYLPLETQSEFCAPCHYGVMGGVMGVGEVTGGVTVYNSYGEWLNSPYSDPKTGKTCQDCHMPVSSAHYFVFPEKGGLNRPYDTLHNHTITGVTDENLMKNAVTVKSSASHSGGALQVQVSVTNDKTGHNVPSDAPIRSVMLVVQAYDANGKLLALNQGPALPDWTGNYAGQPGKAFAKILKDDWTGETPTGAYWRPVTVVADTTLAPFATDQSTYTFALADGSAAKVKVQLIFRRAFQALEQQKGWNDPDLVMAETTIQVEK